VVSVNVLPLFEEWDISCDGADVRRRSRAHA